MMAIASKQEVEQFMQEFFNDAFEALVRCDKNICDKFMRSVHKDTFYKEYWKGLGTWSATEPIVKFLMYLELCPVYRIRPEDWSYSDSKLLDFAIYINEVDHNNIAEIAVEMKWVRFTKEGLLTSNSVQSLVDDFVKIKNVSNPYKYIMHFSITDPTIEFDLTRLNDQIKNEIDGRLIRTMTPIVVNVKTFPTLAESEDKLKNFVLMLWYIDDGK